MAIAYAYALIHIDPLIDDNRPILIDDHHEPEMFVQGRRVLIAPLMAQCPPSCDVERGNSCLRSSDP